VLVGQWRALAAGVVVTVPVGLVLVEFTNNISSDFSLFSQIYAESITTSTFTSSHLASLSQNRHPSDNS
jgi:hypothetical protein